MGLKDLPKGIGAYAQAEAMYGFDVNNYEDSTQAYVEAAKRIFESGVRVQDGRVMEGHNNVRADFAAAAFDSDALKAVKQVALNGGLNETAAAIDVILMRKSYMKDGRHSHLEHINQKGRALAAIGVFSPSVPA